MDPKKATKHFRPLFQEIRAVLKKHDPSGLYALGAPEDEHDDSINQIISLLQHTQAQEEVPDILERVMGDWITDNGKEPKQECSTMAPEVWKAWSTFSGNAG